MIIAGAGIGSTTTLLGRISHLVRCRADPRIIGFPRLVADLRPAKNIDFPRVVYDLRSARAAIEVLREAQARIPGIILLLTFTNHSEDDIADRSTMTPTFRT